MSKISVLVPVYNVAIFLRQCMDSIINQTLKDIEIICINDGSTDDSLEILKMYAQKDLRIKIIDKKNTGYGHSMNMGLQAATGEYIGIVESDDFVEPDMFAQLYSAAINSEAEIVKSNYIEYKNGENYFVELLKDMKYQQNISPNQDMFYKQATIWSAIYKRSFLLKNNICFNETPGASYQDTAFNFKVLACAERMFLLKEAFLHYRTDNANSSVNSRDKVFCVCDEYDEIQLFLERNNILRERYQYLVEVLKFKTYLWNYKRLAYQYKYEFLLKTANEFRGAKNKGLLRREYWSHNDWLVVHELLENTELFHYKKIIAWQKADLYTQGFLSALSDKQIIIYGAGVVGKSVARYIKSKGIQIACFAVSSLAGNVAEVDSVPVRCINDLEHDKNSSVVLVATKDVDQSDIIKNLHQKGFSHVIALDSELRGFSFSNQ